MIYSSLRFVLKISICSALCINLSAAANLYDVYKAAQASDPKLTQALSQQKSIKENLEQSYAALYPTISASANISKNRSTNISNTNATYNRQTYNLQLEQSVYDHKIFMAKDMVELQISGNDSDVLQTQQSLMVRVSNAYFDVLLADDTLNFTQSELKAISRQLDQAKQRYEVGIIAITAVLNAQASFDSTTATALKAENDKRIAQEKLKELTGNYFEQLSHLSPDLPLLKPDPSDISQWVEIALENSPLLQSLQQQVESANKNIKLQYASHYPTVNLSANYQYSDTTGPLSSSAREGTDAAISLQLKVPLFSGGSISSKTRQAQYDAEVLSSKLDEQSRAIERLTRSNYLSLMSTIAQVNALKQAVISNKSSLDATEAGFTVGTRTIVDVLNIQRDLFSAKRNLSAAQYAYIKANILLKQSAGILTEKDIQQVSNWFN